MKPFSTISVVIFLMISIMHLLRLIYKWEVIVYSMRIPIWVILPGCLFTALLSLMVWRESRN